MSPSHPNHSFTAIFRKLTGQDPFPWQEALYEIFIRNEIPSAADLPTGLGKTSVVTIWLIALLTHPEKMPRRLVYVINRRTVVDQTTEEVRRLRERLRECPEWLDKLKAMCAVPVEMPLALSTLRGQFADNREWCADPARPAVIIGTVDMIGSGLLFSRYTCGFKTRPHHAALLGQDVLLIHDEAHLEPAFQNLLGEIVTEQKRCKDARPLRVLELSATTRGAISSFGLTPADEEDPRVVERLRATKRLVLHAISDEKGLADKLIELALARRDSGRAVLIFARSVEVVQRVAAALEKQKLKNVVLTGTMRGFERDKLAQENPEFLRFFPASSRPTDSPAPAEGTVYLVATSAGEVGVNISADDLICDLSTYESVAQRFGRVNRFGITPDGATIELVHPEKFDMEDAYDAARSRTLALLHLLNGNASPDALRKLDSTSRAAAFSPLPEMRPATDILFDSWALTSIWETLPGRPPVAAYLHGEPTKWEPAETRVGWREEVAIISGPLSECYTPKDLEALIDDYALKPHELLRDYSFRVREQLGHIWERVAKESANGPEPTIWLINEDGSVKIEPLSLFADKEAEPRLYGRIVLLPPALGGLSKAGLLAGKTEHLADITYDVAEIENGRKRVFCSTPDVPEEFPKFRLIRAIDTWRAEEERKSDASGDNRYWVWMEPPTASDTGARTANKTVLLENHTCDVEGHAAEIVRKLGLPELIASCVILAARYHDFGKRRIYWQRGIGNYDSKRMLAKAGRELRPRLLEQPYRHEFGSLLDALRESEFQKLNAEEQDLVLHLIAAHHGRGRPHFPLEEAFDPEGAHADSEAAALEVPRRFARLQRKYGRWGLAYLESLLRAADYAASAGIAPDQKKKP